MSIRRLPDDTATRPPVRLQLTSLVDMMVILVVFLLQSFSVEGQLVTPAAGLALPESASLAPVTAGLVVEVGPERVRVAGRDVMATADVVAADAGPLAAALAAAGAGGPVTVQCDRRLDFRVLGRVLRACGQGGRDDVALLVLGGAS